MKSILITGISLLILSQLLPAVFIANWTTLIIAAIVLTLLQKIVRPVLKLLFLPINIITLGLFSWIINIAILWLAQWMVPGFIIGQVTLLGVTFGWLVSLLLVTFIISLIQSIIDLVI